MENTILNPIDRWSNDASRICNQRDQTLGGVMQKHVVGIDRFRPIAEFNYKSMIVRGV